MLLLAQALCARVFIMYSTGPITPARFPVVGGVHMGDTSLLTETPRPPSLLMVKMFLTIPTLSYIGVINY